MKDMQSIRKDMRSVDISLASEDFLMRLFGLRMRYIHGVRSEKSWKKVQRRIHTILKKAVENNFESDAFHNNRIKMYLVAIEKLCNSKEVTDIGIILSMTGIILELLGNLPNYSHRKSLNRHSDYILSGLRSLQYTQTPSQKMRTIIEAARYKPYCDSHNSDDLHEVYVTKYNGNSKGFLEWYKQKYPNIYCEIF